jgi:hypothetical protein
MHLVTALALAGIGAGLAMGQQPSWERRTIYGNRPVPPTKYDFSLIELRLKSNGTGEGRISLTGSIAADTSAKMLTPDNYAGLPVMLKNLTRR